MGKKTVPTIDQRLEALTQSVELLLLSQETTTRNLDRLERLFKFVATGHNKRITKLERRTF